MTSSTLISSTMSPTRNFRRMITCGVTAPAWCSIPGRRTAIISPIAIPYNPSAEALQLATNTVDTPPEENQIYEIGGKVDLLGGGLSLQGALFWTEKSNGRTPDPRHRTASVGGQTTCERI